MSKNTLTVLLLIAALKWQVHSYCDQWTPCQSNLQCFNKNCVPLNCVASNDCATDFQCRSNKCVSLKNVANDGTYCDQWTFCLSTQQCFEKKCIPLDCNYDTDCIEGFGCYRLGKCAPYTAYLGEERGYCDEWTKCGSTHQCVNKKCVPLSCQWTPNCILNYRCVVDKCHRVPDSPFGGISCNATNQCDTLHNCINGFCQLK